VGQINFIVFLPREVVDAFLPVNLVLEDIVPGKFIPQEFRRQTKLHPVEPLVNQ
jgi:hypothetical protein